MSHGLVLSGGGAFASYGVGVVKALLRGESATTNYEPLVPRAISGTSAGGFTAAVVTSMLAEGGPTVVDYLEDLWLNRVASTPFTTCGNGVFRLRGNPTNYLNPACYVPNPFRPLIDLARDTGVIATDGLRRLQHVVFESETLAERILEQIAIEPLIDVEPFRKLVREAIPYDNIRSSRIKLSINATNWDKGTVRFFENAEFTPEFGPRIVSAAASIPGVFPPHEIDGDNYVDGSVLVDAPLRVVIREGVEDLHVVTHLPLDVDRPWPDFANLPEVLWRLQEIKWAATLQQDIEYARDINDGLTFLEGQASGQPRTREAERAMVRVARTIGDRISDDRPYVKLNVHVYNPPQPLGGFLGFLNFEKNTISRYIERGYEDTLNHDCSANGCILVNGNDTRTSNAQYASTTH